MAMFAYSYMAVALSHIVANGHKPSKPTSFTLFERTNPYWNMQVRSEKHDGASKISARVRRHPPSFY